MFEVYDVNYGDTLHTFKSWSEAYRCAADMNRGHLDKMYAVREAE